MKPVRTSLATLAALALAGGVAAASTLQLSPVLIDVDGPASAEKVTLKNLGDRPINAQIRLFKWTQKNGRDVLEPTREVVASPPIASIGANGEQVVRVVRVDRTQLAGETSYRLLVDQLPEQAAPTKSGVSFLMRYSVPVFFAPKAQVAPQLTWQIEARGGALHITATNPGSRRVRVAELSISSQSGATVASRKGLVGYVLGGSTATWQLSGASLVKGVAVRIEARGDDGPIRAQAVAR